MYVRAIHFLLTYFISHKSDMFRVLPPAPSRRVDLHAGEHGGARWLCVRASIRRGAGRTAAACDSQTDAAGDRDAIAGASWCRAAAATRHQQQPGWCAGIGRAASDRREPGERAEGGRWRRSDQPIATGGPVWRHEPATAARLQTEPRGWRRRNRERATPGGRHVTGRQCAARAAQRRRRRRVARDGFGRGSAQS